MTMVEVGIAAEHLFDDALDVLVEILRETGRFANPVLGTARKDTHGLIKVGRWGADGSLGGIRSLAITRSESGRLNILGRIGGKDVRVVNLANDPSLYPNNVGGGGDLGRPTILEPGVCESRVSVAVLAR